MRYGIIGAMDEEIEFLKNSMTDKEEVKIASILFIEGNLEGKEVILMKSGIGKVNAAMATTILLERFQPTHVINTGSAGGFSNKLNVGDIVVGNKVIHHDVDVTAFDYEYGQVPNMPAAFMADPNLVERTTDVLKKLSIHSEIGLITTGDSFMSDPKRVEFVREMFPDMLAAEMEGAAIAQVCYQYQTPFVIIRALSDIAGVESPVTFNEFLQLAAKNATKIITEIIKSK